MIIRVSEAGAVAIEDHDLFTGFHVDAPVGHTAEDIAAVLGEGTSADDRHHVWIAADAVRHWVADLATEEWEEGFTAMVDYARGRGWMDESGTHIRAHLEHDG